MEWGTPQACLCTCCYCEIVCCSFLRTDSSFGKSGAHLQPWLFILLDLIVPFFFFFFTQVLVWHFSKLGTYVTGRI